MSCCIVWLHMQIAGWFNLDACAYDDPSMQICRALYHGSPMQCIRLKTCICYVLSSLILRARMSLTTNQGQRQVALIKVWKVVHLRCTKARHTSHDKLDQGCTNYNEQQRLWEYPFLRQGRIWCTHMCIAIHTYDHDTRGEGLGKRRSWQCFNGDERDKQMMLSQG